MWEEILTLIEAKYQLEYFIWLFAISGVIAFFKFRKKFKKFSSDDLE